jgi:hypothetical protein
VATTTAAPKKLPGRRRRAAHFRARRVFWSTATLLCQHQHLNFTLYVLLCITRLTFTDELIMCPFIIYTIQWYRFVVKYTVTI